MESLWSLLDQAAANTRQREAAMHRDHIEIEEKHRKNAFTQKTVGELNLASDQQPVTKYLGAADSSSTARVALNEEVSSDVKTSLESVVEKQNLALPSKSPLVEGGNKKKRSDGEKSTAGSKWFDMPAAELTPEVERDLKLLKLRHVLDPKRFYKKDDSFLGGRKKGAKAPQFFQIGTIVDTPLDYHNRLTKKERKRHIVDDLLADDESRRYYKKKFMEVQERQAVNQSKQYHAIKRRRLDTYKQLSKQSKRNK